jgi:hypothetical protein
VGLFGRAVNWGRRFQVNTGRARAVPSTPILGQQHQSQSAGLALDRSARRRFAFSVTSVSGLPGPKLITAFIAYASLALLGFDHILGAGDRLTHVGT